MRNLCPDRGQTLESATIVSSRVKKDPKARRVSFCESGDAPINCPFLVKKTLPPASLSLSLSAPPAAALFLSARSLALFPVRSRGPRGGPASVQSIPQPTMSPVVKVGPNGSPVPWQQKARPSSAW